MFMTNNMFVDGQQTSTEFTEILKIGHFLRRLCPFYRSCNTDTRISCIVSADTASPQSLQTPNRPHHNPSDKNTSWLFYSFTFIVRVWSTSFCFCFFEQNACTCMCFSDAACPPCGPQWWECTPVEFQYCLCIPRSLCKDGRQHCYDWSDEYVCTRG